MPEIIRKKGFKIILVLMLGVFIVIGAYFASRYFNAAPISQYTPEQVLEAQKIGNWEFPDSNYILKNFESISLENKNIGAAEIGDNASGNTLMVFDVGFTQEEILKTKDSIQSQLLEKYNLGKLYLKSSGNRTGKIGEEFVYSTVGWNTANNVKTGIIGFLDCLKKKESGSNIIVVVSGNTAEYNEGRALSFVNTLDCPIDDGSGNSSGSVNDKLDTDTDGLTDKVEKMLGSDPYKKDTDGDGFNDFEELQEGYNPMLPRPYDKYTEGELIKVKKDIKYVSVDVYNKLFGKDVNLILPMELRTLAVMIPPVAPATLSGPAVFKEEVSLSNKNWKYSFYAPADIDMNKEQVLVIGLHDFESSAADYIKFWQSDADKGGFLVAILQSYPKTYPSGATIESYPWLEISDFTKAVLAHIEKKYKIDENRIFLTGYSAGASASYIIALDSGIKFKGVVPINGYLPLDAGIIDKLSKIRDVNFYVVHEGAGADLDAVIIQEKILAQYGAKMEFKILSDLGGRYPAAEHENILKWMEGIMQK